MITTVKAAIRGPQRLLARLTLTRKPPAASTLRSVPIATPRPTALLVCSLSARYMAKSSAISPDWMGIMPVYGWVY